MAVDSQKPNAKVVIVTNLTRNVVKAHLQVIFGVYGDVAKIDLPVYGKSGQNRGKAAVEYAESQAARKAASQMDGGQLDGAVLKVELSDLPVRSRSRSPPRGGPRNGRDRPRSFSRSRTRSRTRSPPPRYRRRGDDGGYRGREWDGDRHHQGTIALLALPVARGHAQGRLSVAGTPVWDHAEGHPATREVDTAEDAQGPAATPCALVAPVQDLFPVRARALAPGHGPCPTLLIRNTAGAEVALDLAAAEPGGVTAETTSETADQGPSTCEGLILNLLATISDEHLSVILSEVSTDATFAQVPEVYYVTVPRLYILLKLARQQPCIDPIASRLTPNRCLQGMG
ncbi:RNA-binding protein with serine-rich domain [Salix suchowensis]|nr:RNA-binding protein with serine-rich domain [Salix suchowensis]